MNKRQAKKMRKKQEAENIKKLKSMWGDAQKGLWQMWIDGIHENLQIIRELYDEFGVDLVEAVKEMEVEDD